MRAIVFAGAGGPEVMTLQERPAPEPGGAEVVVRVRYAGLNPADLAQRAGFYPAPPDSPADVPGLEVAGVVERCGPRVARWREGDRVLGLVGGGGLADRVLVHERCLAPVPDGVSEPDAAALPEAFITAHDAIRSQAGLTMGETLLVHGANGGVGSAAVQIGVATGARVLAAVRSQAAEETVRALGAEPVADAAFVDAVRELTGGAGVDVVLELVGAPHFPGNLEALAPLGRIVVVGTGAGHEAELPLRLVMGRRARILGTMLRARPLEQKGAAVRAFEREVLPLVARGTIHALVDSTFPAEQAAQAFERLAAKGKAGKVLVDFGA
jgi:putative PIG3 family NAD(P)H quinone oxidoreductase